MICFCAAPERETQEKLAMRDKMMRVFEAEKAQGRAAPKGKIFMSVEGSEGSEEVRVPGLEAATNTVLVAHTLSHHHVQLFMSHDLRRRSTGRRRLPV